MSRINSWAENELNLIGMMESDNPDDEMNVAMRKHILHMLSEFSKEGHSGFSASYAISILTRLLKWKPLSPLTGEDSEWGDISHYGADDPKYQNIRYSSVFRNQDGYCYDSNGRVFWEWAKDEDGNPCKVHFTNRHSSVKVTFPYMPPDEPELVEWREEDWVDK